KGFDRFLKALNKGLVKGIYFLLKGFDRFLKALIYSNKANFY
ncbi:MAG: hypothetical protein UR73_C0001G0013, partial [candidate division WS6 bacterium GW2011_GWF1_35_23]